jgi:putative transposase
VKFEFIESEKANFPIVFMCRHLKVSRSGFYAWRGREEPTRAKEDRELVEFIKAEFKRTPRGCGSRPIVAALRTQRRPVSRKRVVRLMKANGLRHRLKRRFRVMQRTCDSSAAARNVLKRKFTPGRVNRVWVADFTCIHTKRHWAYLSTILDVGSRRVVGWSVGPSADQELTLRALRMAIRERRPARGLIHHSDRGVQYAASAYRAQLREVGAICSMSRKGNCWDNAVVESFFSTLKRELPNDHVFEDWREVERAVFEYIAAHYNTKRRHSALGYLSPNQYEERRAA